jgi:hypothetical protein
MWLDRRMRAIPPGLVALVLGLGLAASARADATDERGRFHFQAGASYYEAGDYEDALREFERAHDVSQRPELFYNISLCHQQLGHLAEAADYLQKYLEQVENIPNRVNLERRLQNLQARLEAREAGEAEPEPESEPDAQVAPAAAPPPGPGTFEGDTRTVGVDRDDGRKGVPLAAILGWSIGGSLLLGGAITGIMALGERSNLQDDPCSVTRTCDVSRLDRLSLMTDILIPVGLTAAVVGTVLFFVLRNRGGGESPSSPAVQVSPWVDPMGGGGATLGGRF